MCNGRCDRTLMKIWSAELHKEQAILCHEIENIYQTFDNEFIVVADDYIEIALSLKFMESYYLTVYQELLVCSQFEEPQKQLLETIADLTIKEKGIEKEIEMAKMPLKKFIGMENDESSTNDLNELFKSNGL